jgi:hypothetical protein
VRGALLKLITASKQLPDAGSPAGYVQITATGTNYTFPVEAYAVVQTSCSYDGSGADQSLSVRAAIKETTETSATVADTPALPIQTVAANRSVQSFNTDWFPLTAGLAYNFGVSFDSPTPANGTNADVCWVVVMVYSQ